MSFGGMLTGGDDANEKKETPKAEVKIEKKEEVKEEVEKLATNTKEITE